MSNVDEDILRIRKAETKNYIDKLSDEANQVLLIVIRELFAEDPAHFLAEQFRVPRQAVRSVFDPEVVFAMEPSLRNCYKKNEIPNDGFVEAVRAWLASLERDELIRVTNEILAEADISAVCKILRFTRKDNDNGYFLHKIMQVYGVSFHEINNALLQFSEKRNAASHWSDANFDQLDPKKAIDEIDSLMLIFQRNATGKKQEKLSDYFRNSKITREAFDLPWIKIAEVEEKYKIPDGSLREALKRSTLFSRFMDREGTTILFTKEGDLLFQIDSIKLTQAVNAAPAAMVEQHTDPSVKELLNLPKYHSGKFTQGQLTELVQNFSVLADSSVLLSVDGLEFIAKELFPILQREKAILQIEWGTLVYIHRMISEGSDDDIRKTAKWAKNLLFHMHSKQLVRYVGTTDCSADPTQSVLQLLKNNNHIPSCVITIDKTLVNRMLRETVPNSFCVWLWGNRGVFPCSETAERYRSLCTNRADVPTERKKSRSGDHAVDNTPAVPVQDSAVKQAAIPEHKSYIRDFCVPVSIPKTGYIVEDESQSPVKLIEIIGQPGGEGTVYRTDRDGVVAKIYHLDKITEERYKKLHAMREIQLNVPNVCWPTSLVFNEHSQFVGFLMPAAPDNTLELGVSVMKLLGKSIKNVLQGWDRLSVVECCIAVADTFGKLHHHNVFMGDVNPRNILVCKDRPEAVYFVDCDSYQVGPYNCPVGMAEYSSPKYLKALLDVPGGYASCPRTKDDEQFSLATLLFKMIMLGQSPFASKDADNVADAIRDYQFYFKNDKDSGENAPVGPYPMIWSNTPKRLKSMFANVFNGDLTFSADQWLKQFVRYKQEIQQGTYTRELNPRKYPDFTGKMFTDFICAECGQEANMLTEVYNRNKNSRKYCRNCFSLHQRARTMEARINCDCCAGAYTATEYDVIEQENGRKWYCERCRSAICRGCGKRFGLSPKLIESRRLQPNKPVWCKACHEKWRENNR